MDHKPVVNTLFTSVGRRVKLLRAFRRAYETLSIQGSIVATDIDPLAPALQEADRFYLVPRLTDPGYVPALVDICEREQSHLVFPLIDPDIPVLAHHRHRLEATGARVVVVPEQAVQITTDKWQTYRFFEQMGLPVPKSWLPGHLQPDADGDIHLNYPVFIKPRFGSAGKDSFKVCNRRELDFFVGYVPDPIIQEYLPGPEVTNDVVCDLTGQILAVVSRQRIEVRWGEVAKGKTIYDPRVVQQCAEIARKLEAIGPITIQYMNREGQPHYTEINARFGGGAPLGIAAGVLSPNWLLANAAGIGVDIPPLGTYQRGQYLTRFDDSFILTDNDLGQIESHRL